jgi:hypothetical protein
MLVFTVAALAVAAVAGVGAFEPQTGKQPAAVVPPGPAGTPAPLVLVAGPPTLIVTFVLVETQQQLDLLRTGEKQMIFREYLAKYRTEYLLAGTPEQEALALRQIEARKADLVAARYDIVDLRRQAD